MPYRPKIITGIIKDTGLPIDGHELYLTRWDYDREHWHLYGWDDEHDEAVMLTMYETKCKRQVKAGAFDFETFETFTEKWKAKLWAPAGAFTLELSQVEVLEVKQEEEKSEIREKLIAGGFDFSSRRTLTFCLPLDKNLNGDVQAKHPDWEPVDCPGCGCKCWKAPISEKVHKNQEVQYLCTECAIGAELVAPFTPEKNTPKPGGNRAQRRRAKYEHRRR